MCRGARPQFLCSLRIEREAARSPPGWRSSHGHDYRVPRDGRSSRKPQIGQGGVTALRSIPLSGRELLRNPVARDGIPCHAGGLDKPRWAAEPGSSTRPMRFLFAAASTGRAGSRPASTRGSSASRSACGTFRSTAEWSTACTTVECSWPAWRTPPQSDGRTGHPQRAGHREPGAR